MQQVINGIEFLPDYTGQASIAHLNTDKLDHLDEQYANHGDPGNWELQTLSEPEPDVIYYGVCTHCGYKCVDTQMYVYIVCGECGGDGDRVEDDYDFYLRNLTKKQVRRQRRYDIDQRYDGARILHHIATGKALEHKSLINRSHRVPTGESDPGDYEPYTSDLNTVAKSSVKPL